MRHVTRSRLLVMGMVATAAALILGATHLALSSNDAMTEPGPTSGEVFHRSIAESDEGDRQTTVDDPAPASPAPKVFQPVPLGDGAESETTEPSWTVTLAHDPAAAGVGTDFTVPGVPAATAFDQGFGYSAGQGGCSISCISSGVAYPDGFGARLAVTTPTPATIWITVWNDHGYINTQKSSSGRTDFSAVFDDLAPDAEYSAMAVAQDNDGRSDHRYGAFTSPGQAMSLELDTGILHALPAGVPDSAEDVAANVFTYVFVNGQPIAGGINGTLPVITDPSSAVDIQVLVRVRHDLDMCAASAGPSVPATTPGFFDESSCISQVTLARWVGGSMAPVSLSGHDEATFNLTVAPGFDIGLDAEVKLTLRRIAT